MGKVKKIKLLDNSEYDIEDASAAHIQTVTLAEWEALTPEQQASGDYVVTGINAAPLSASLIPYDNTLSGLAATTAQGAIDEVNNSIPDNADFSLSGLSDTAINTPIVRNLLSFDGDLQKWVNSIPNGLVGNIESDSSIRGLLVDTTIPKGVYFYNSRYASDNPETAVTVAMIYKNNANGTYSKVYAFINDKIYFAKADSSVPATLTWVDITNPDSTNIKSQITWNETTASGTGAYKNGNMVYITYQGESKTHSNGDTLFVLPTGLRPIQNWEASFTVDGKAYGQVHVLANGNVNINNISDNTVTGRIYFSVSFPIA